MATTLTTPSTSAANRSALAPLGLPIFRKVWIASTLSNLGGLIQSVGAAWMMTSIASSADMEDIDEPIMGAGDGLECRHPLELALERPLAFERDAVNHFHCPPGTG